MTNPDELTTGDKPVRVLSQVNKAKESISEANTVWYESGSLEKSKLEERVRDLRDTIYDGYISSSGRVLKDVLLTNEEIAERNRFVFTQKDVTEYESPKEIKRRRRELTKGDLFEPPVALADIIPKAQRESREKGLHRPSFRKMLENHAMKKVVTSNCSPIDALSDMAKTTQLLINEEWITEEEWIGDNKLSDEQIDIKLSQIAGAKIGLELEPLQDYHDKVVKINGSGPTFINAQDQHTVANAQGGLSQRPVDITSHWYEHLLLANDATEALEIILPIQEIYSENDNLFNDAEELQRLTQLVFNAYKLNTPSAELLRGSIPLSPNISTKYILEKRKNISANVKDILERAKSLDTGKAFKYLTPEDEEYIIALAKKIEKGRGAINDEENEEPDVFSSNKEYLAIERLKQVVDEIDCNNAINRLRNSLDKLNKYKANSLDIKHIVNIQNLIDRLEDEKKAIYLNSLREDEYNSLLELQETLDEDILIDIVVPYKIRNVRPAWRYRLDLEKMGDIVTLNPYDDKGLELRMLLDVLEAPNFKTVLKSNGAPRRVELSEEQLKDSSLSDTIYGDLKYVDLLQGHISNEILNNYYESVGIKTESDMLAAMFPDRNNEQPPSALQNVDRAAQMVYEAIQNEEGIATIGDCDQDGFFASINWRWVLEHMGVEEIEQKFNTRLEGHHVQPIDLLNLALDGNALIIVNDTGSSEKDAQTFKMIKNGIADLEDLEFFRENIDLISGFNKLSDHQKREIKRKLTECINKYQEDGLDFDDFLNAEITTGEKYTNENGTVKNKHMRLIEFEPLKRFLEGFPDLKIIVCDHHTSSIEGIQYFRDKKDIVMVNPQWVREGFEDTFINEMQQALIPSEDGTIDVEEIDRIQRKYICYPESDIVGAVTATKVMKRVMQLFSPDEIVSASPNGLYCQEREKRVETYEELAKKVCKLDIDQEKGEDLKKLTIRISKESNIEISLEDLWLEEDPLSQINSRITQIFNSLQYITDSIVKNKSVIDAVVSLKEIEQKWPVKINNKNEFVKSIFYARDMGTILGISVHIDKYLSHIEQKYDERIKKVRENNELSDSELRFYLEYAKRLPKSIFEMERDEKEEYVIPYVKMLAGEITAITFLEGGIEEFGVNLHEHVLDLIENHKTLRDVKKDFFDLIEKGYEEYGGIPENDRTGEIPDQRTKVRYEGNKIWDRAINSLLENGLLTPDLLRGLESYFEYGGHGLEFLHLTQATATLGDGGSVGIDGGLENRTIVKNGMRAIEEFADDYWDAKTKEEKAIIKRIQPEILRLIRTSLRGTHIKSINWNLSRLLTHGVSAFVNSMYRRAKDERPGRAKEFWKEAADFCLLRSDNESNRRHRHTLIYAQEVSVARRKELLKGIVKELESSYDELEKPIIITKLEGRAYVDPVKGLRGLIAGELADRYNKPAMVVVEEKKEKPDTPARYSVSFRLPGKGNVATDMVQLSLKMNPKDGITILGNGGHPEASGGTWEVIGGFEKLHKVLDPIFKDFKLKNPDAGIVKIEKVIEKTTKEMKKDGWEDIQNYKEYVNAFDIADTIATHTYKQTNPYGTDIPPLLVEFENLTVVSISRGTKNDGEDYYSIQVRDARGNTKTMRLFKDLEDFSGIQRGDVLTLRAQPIMRLRALEPCNLQYRFTEEFNPSFVTGALSKPHLDIVKIVDIQRGYTREI
jgi:single-stranded DNA-specific DHH superfamily exonuclease